MVRGSRSRCSRCSAWSERVHSRYQRLLADLPIAGQLVKLRLTVRRFFCDNVACESKTFAEQVEGLTRRRTRRSEPLRMTLTSIGLALAGRARESGWPRRSGSGRAETVSCGWSGHFLTQHLGR
ncbi:transposase family protein [Actinoplanes sp. NPDC051346]|uniref:transposase family protein n=1 Tax=Actinoplanes sp. NPDC051346 TaxID=3155048 RepID=UPI00342A4428